MTDEHCTCVIPVYMYVHVVWGLLPEWSGGGGVEDVNAHGSVHINTLSNRYENFPPIDQQNSDVFPMILVILEFGANSLRF